MTAHTCDSCGMLHDAPTSVESPEVTIERIRAESAYKIAQLQARADKHVAEVEADTAVELAETEAEVAVDVAEAQAEVIAEVMSDPEPEPAPMAIIQDVDPGPPVEEDAPPVVDKPVHEDKPKARKTPFFGF